MKNCVIVSAVRTAIGCFNGSLASTSAIDLGATVIKAAIERAKIDSLHIDEEFGNESAQTGMLHHQLDPSVEGELHQNTGSTACCRADSTHISHWRFM